MICKKCNKPFITRPYINKKRLDCRGRVYCFQCKPLKNGIMPDEKFVKNYINSNSASKQIGSNFINLKCKYCFSEFESRLDKNVCKKCVCLILKIKKRIFSVNYKGGKCEKCNWKPENINEYVCLDFHHLDPNLKEFDLSKSFKKKNIDIQNELDKCIMLCAMCHRKQHMIEYNIELCEDVLKGV